ncbi:MULTISPECIES: hypothetical protein [Streptomyces]|uniref:Uncharacterized protein n=1 Tax=Streptomyces flavotricini TaxID=66888 RepID=A0ABS8EG87_9ACTN|nr:MULTISPECIES: hypothetical protein [Streptomyces]MCC0100165.1 hypothetical protein [Streptomyces flavotricini]WSI29515.1 hypothetical protein OG311_39745 [Streptomyces sp. NBC_01343]
MSNISDNELVRIDTIVEDLRALDATETGQEALSMTQALASPGEHGEF